MLLPNLRDQVLQANLELVRQGLVYLHSGMSAALRAKRDSWPSSQVASLMISMTAADLVVTDLAGKIVEGGMRPSSDLPTHLALYNCVPHDRRSSPHAFRICHGVGTGSSAHPLLRDHAC